MNAWHSRDIRAAIDSALDASKADATVARFHWFEEGATRYSDNEISQNVVTGDAELRIEVAFGARVGSCETNRLEADSIAACVRRAEEIARLAPPDPEYMPPVEPLAVPRVAMWHEATPKCSPAQRAGAIGRAVAVTQAEEMSAAGVFTTRFGGVAVGNSAGHFAESRTTMAELKVSATSPDSVGWAQASAYDVDALDVEATARRAVEKARAGRRPRASEPGRYEVILEPAAVEEFLSFFFWYQMEAKAADEGRTFLTGKKGTRIAHPKVGVFSDPTWPAAPSRPFTGEGLPLRRVDWLRGGVLNDMIYSRYWARKQSVAPTGWPSNLIMEGGSTPVEDMLRSTANGLLVTRFWYVRAVEPIRDLYTGMTRDGTFLIRDGEIAGPVKNLRFNESVVRFLKNVESLGAQELLRSWVWALVPTVKACDFNFTSTTRF